MLAVALPSIANQFPSLFGGDQGLTVAIAPPPAFSVPPSRPPAGRPG